MVLLQIQQCQDRVQALASTTPTPTTIHRKKKFSAPEEMTQAAHIQAYEELQRSFHLVGSWLEPRGGAATKGTNGTSPTKSSRISATHSIGTTLRLSSFRGDQLTNQPTRDQWHWTTLSSCKGSCRTRLWWKELRCRLGLTFPPTRLRRWNSRWVTFRPRSTETSTKNLPSKLGSGQDLETTEERMFWISS